MPPPARKPTQLSIPSDFFQAEGFWPKSRAKAEKPSTERFARFSKANPLRTF
jgi:hypothetical protein